MCGIAGIYHYANKTQVDKQELLQIRDAMAVRGPDGSGLWLSEGGNLGLAHRRLSIIDLSEAGSQPMLNNAGDLCVTFNGEIYNYPELRHSLEQQGCIFQSHSDTEVLLHLYRLYGTDMFTHLRGMYAFALWDQQQESLLLGRDPFGIKPLYYADDQASIRFASQVKALLTSSAINTRPSAAGHTGFFLWGSVPDPFTLYQGIRALPAGHYLRIDRNGQHEFRSFWSISQEIAEAEHLETQLSDQQVKENLHALLTDSIQHHLLADVPVGLFLSSGLDSSVLTAIMADTVKQLTTLTLGFSEYRGRVEDEVPLAESVAAHCQTRHQTHWITRDDFNCHFERILDVMDQPTIDGVNTYFISKAAADAGLKVALSGLGGDELFGGYPSFQGIPKLLNWLSPFHCFRGMGAGLRFLSAPLLKNWTSPKYAGVLEYGTEFSGAYLLRRGLFMPWELPQFLEPELVKIGWNELQNTLGQSELIEGIQELHLKVTAFESAWYMRHQLLRDADWAGMAHALEIRVPLVDIKLWRGALPLLKLPNKPGKAEMANCLTKKLPEAIVNRKKTGFTVPVQQWLFNKIEENDSFHQRGLRGWAYTVYKAQAGDALLLNRRS